MASEKVLVIIEVQGGCVQEVTCGDFVDVRIIDYDNDPAHVCPECGCEDAEPDMSTAEDRWICVQCSHNYEAEEAEYEEDQDDG